MKKQKNYIGFVAIALTVGIMSFIGCGQPDRTAEIEAQRALVNEYRALEAERSENMKKEQYREMMTEGIRTLRKDEVHYT